MDFYFGICSVNEVSSEHLGDIFFAVNEDKGVSEVALKTGAGSIDPHILSVNEVVLIFFLFCLGVRAAWFVWILVWELVLVRDWRHGLSLAIVLVLLALSACRESFLVGWLLLCLGWLLACLGCLVHRR